MSEASVRIIGRLTRLATRRFAYEVRLKVRNDVFKAKQAAQTAAHAALTAKMNAQIELVDIAIWETASRSRGQLIDKGSKSFAIMVATFTFRKNPVRRKINNPNAVLAFAKKKGYLKKIADLVRSWKLNNDKFFVTLPTLSDKDRAALEPFIDDLGGDESLILTPNGTHAVMLDGKRISPPSITIKMPPKS